jgi:hypothetical protein
MPIVNGEYLDRLWKKIVISISGDRYLLKHGYLELLGILGKDSLAGLNGVVLNIKNLGLLKVSFVSFENSTNTIAIQCKMVGEK